jgi:hypothetical protein
LPHKECKNGAAHFEHHPWNFECPLRDRDWDASRLERLLRKKPMTPDDAELVMEGLIEKLEIKGITFNNFIDRVQSLGIKLPELLDRFANDVDGLISQAVSGEKQAATQSELIPTGAATSAETDGLPDPTETQG